MSLVIEPGGIARNYWRDLWRFRELLYFLAWRDIVVRYKQAALGIAWAVVRPALIMAVFVAFRRMVGVRPSSIPDPVLVLAGVLPWQFFSTALTEASGSLIGNANLVSKVYFPRLIIPLSSVATSLVDFIITLAMLAIVMAWYGCIPDARIVALPLFIIATFVLAAGMGLWLAALNVEYRDFRFIVPFIVQFGMFISPVAFTSSVVPVEWKYLYSFNPMAGIIEGFRWCLLRQDMPLDPMLTATSIAVSLAFLFVGMAYFRRMERNFADVI